jgi:hypothetical protein
MKLTDINRKKLIGAAAVALGIVIIFASVHRRDSISSPLDQSQSSAQQQPQQPQRQADPKADEVRRKASAQKAHINFKGIAHDPFTCSVLNDASFVSFDSGETWWTDEDGRCAASLKLDLEAAQLKRSEEVQREEAEEQRRRAEVAQEAQKARDSDAEIHSYWSTTVRVDTDMNSSWLADEERVCQTYPDEHGRVATVRCDADAGSIHNIPVAFWGGVDRNTISEWKCRRQKGVLSDSFVCRAIN